MLRPANLARLLICLIVCLALPAFGLREAAGSRAWFQALAHPAFIPTPAAFSAAWMIVSLLSALAAFWIWQRIIPPDRVRLALAMFLAQWLLSALWFYLFFTRRELLAAFEIIIFAWFTLALTAICFARVSRPAALLLLPALAWIACLAALTGALIRLNFPGHVG